MDARDQANRLLDSLSNPRMRSIVAHRLEGRTNEETAQAIGLSIRTIERLLETARIVLSRVYPDR